MENLSEILESDDLQGESKVGDVTGGLEILSVEDSWKFQARSVEKLMKN